MTPEAAIERVFKEHSARILATLVRVFGAHNFELAEDVLQEAFRKAVGAWGLSGIPEDPAAWILTAAKRQAIDVVRSQRTHRKFSLDLRNHLESDWTLSHTIEREFDESRIRDHQLRMIFMCTNADVTPENRLPLILRSLCGFGISAIARALLLPEATVKKRLVRTREKLKDHAFEFPSEERIPEVMESVHTVLYLLFNEGFHSSDEAAPMQLELCREAIHLATLLGAEPRVVNRETLGLLALMGLHFARATSRLDEAGSNVPLDRQDRTLWDREAILEARRLLVVASAMVPAGSRRFFIEARIAEQHCIAPAFSATDWGAIVVLYDELVAATESPVAELNRAVAMGYSGQVEAAIESVHRISSHDVFRRSHLAPSVLAHLLAMKGDAAAARTLAETAARLGGTPHEQRVLFDQIERLLADR